MEWIHPCMHKLQGWGKVEHFMAPLQPFATIELEVPGRALSPAWGRPRDCAAGW